MLYARFRLRRLASCLPFPVVKIEAAPAFFVCLTLLLQCGGDEAQQQERYAEALQAYNERNHPHAAQILEEILAEDADFANARIMLGKIEYFNRNFERAQSQFEQAHDAAPQNANARVWLARTLLLDSEERARALEILNDLVQSDSAHAEAWYLKGRVHQLQGDSSQAIAAYNSALSRGRSIALAHAELGGLYLEAGLPDDAQRHFRLAVLIGDGDPGIRDRITVLQAQHGAGDGADAAAENESTDAAGEATQP